LLVVMESGLSPDCISTTRSDSAAEISRVLLRLQAWFDNDMEHTRRVSRIKPVIIALSLTLLAACSSSSDNNAPVTQQTQEDSPPGRLTIKAATASRGQETAAFVFDHDPLKYWNSEAFAPGWIQVELERPAQITRIRLLTTQSPPGQTSHQILGGLTPDSLAPLGTFDGDTTDSQWLELQAKVQVRYVRVVTLSSPSWVGWREVEVYQ